MIRGIKTSEFWVTVVAAIVSVLLAAQVLEPGQAEEIQGAGTAFVLAVFELAKVLAPVLGAAVYTWSRTRVKVGK